MTEAILYWIFLPAVQKVHRQKHRWSWHNTNTLDTTTRKVVFEQTPFLLSDTVGFIRKLPHHLVESFKSTLDEVREADILLHVVDISHPKYEEQLVVVNKTLAELGCTDKPTI